MIGLFTLFSAILWYLIDIVKEVLGKFREANDRKLPDLLYDLVIWVLAIGGGMLLAIQFKLDAFVLVSQLMDNVIEIPVIEPTFIGNIFGGLLLASGSGVINKLLKAIGGRDENSPPEEPTV